MGNLGIDKRIASTQHLIDLAEQAEKDRSPLQSITDSFSSSHEPGREDLDAAAKYLQEAKELAIQGNFKKASRFERLAFEAVHEFHRESWDSQRRFVAAAEPVAQAVKITGDSLFAIGVTGALVAAALPGALALAVKGSAQAFLAWAVTSAGGGAGFALASALRRGLDSLFGGEEKVFEESLLQKGFREGTNFSSFQFFAPFAALQGQAWAQNLKGLSKELMQLLPFSFLQSAHGAAQVVSEGGGVKEATIAAGTGALLPFFFHGLERIVQLPSNILNRLRRGKAMELYRGARATQDTPVEEAIDRAKELFRLNDQEIANAKLVKERYREIIRQKHSDLGGNGNSAEIAELTALRDLLISGENSPFAQAYVQGKILRATQATPLATSSKIEVVDLSNDLVTRSKKEALERLIKEEIVATGNKSPFLFQGTSFLNFPPNPAAPTLPLQYSSMFGSSPSVLRNPKKFLTASEDNPTDPPSKGNFRIISEEWLLSEIKSLEASLEDPKTQLKLEDIVYNATLSPKVRVKAAMALRHLNRCMLLADLIKADVPGALEALGEAAKVEKEAAFALGLLELTREREEENYQRVLVKVAQSNPEAFGVLSIIKKIRGSSSLSQVWEESKFREFLMEYFYFLIANGEIPSSDYKFFGKLAMEKTEVSLALAESVKIGNLQALTPLIEAAAVSDHANFLLLSIAFLEGNQVIFDRVVAAAQQHPLIAVYIKKFFWVLEMGQEYGWENRGLKLRMAIVKDFNLSSLRRAARYHPWAVESLDLFVMLGHPTARTVMANLDFDYQFDLDCIRAISLLENAGNPRVKSWKEKYRDLLNGIPPGLYSGKPLPVRYLEYMIQDPNALQEDREAADRYLEEYYQSIKETKPLPPPPSPSYGYQGTVFQLPGYGSRPASLILQSWGPASEKFGKFKIVWIEKRRSKLMATLAGKDLNGNTFTVEFSMDKNHPFEIGDEVYLLPEIKGGSGGGPLELSGVQEKVVQLAKHLVETLHREWPMGLQQAFTFLNLAFALKTFGQDHLAKAAIHHARVALLGVSFPHDPQQNEKAKQAYELIARREKGDWSFPPKEGFYLDPEIVGAVRREEWDSVLMRVQALPISEKAETISYLAKFLQESREGKVIFPGKVVYIMESSGAKIDRVDFGGVELDPRSLKDIADLNAQILRGERQAIFQGKVYYSTAPQTVGTFFSISAHIDPSTGQIVAMGHFQHLPEEIREKYPRILFYIRAYLPSLDPAKIDQVDFDDVELDPKIQESLRSLVGNPFRQVKRISSDEYHHIDGRESPAKAEKQQTSPTSGQGDGREVSDLIENVKKVPLDGLASPRMEVVRDVEVKLEKIKALTLKAEKGDWRSFEALRLLAREENEADLTVKRLAEDFLVILDVRKLLEQARQGNPVSILAIQGLKNAGHGVAGIEWKNLNTDILHFPPDLAAPEPSMAGDDFFIRSPNGKKLPLPKVEGQRVVLMNKNALWAPPGFSSPMIVIERIFEGYKIVGSSGDCEVPVHSSVLLREGDKMRLGDLTLDFGEVGRFGLLEVDPPSGKLRPLTNYEPLPVSGEVWEVKAVETNEVILAHGQRIRNGELKPIEGIRIIPKSEVVVTLKPGDRVRLPHGVEGGSGTHLPGVKVMSGMEWLVGEEFSKLLMAAEYLASDPNSLRDTALENFKWIRLEDPHSYVTAATDLLAGKVEFRGGWRDSDEKKIARGLTLLRLLGLSWKEMGGLVVPSAIDFYTQNSRLNSLPGEARYMGYVWPVPAERPLAVLSESFRQTMDIQPGQIILDPLAGSGEEMIVLARSHSGLRILANDLNPDNIYLGLLRAQDEKISPENLTFLLHDAHDPFPITTDSVDRIVINNHSTYGFSEKQLESFYGEMLRALRPNGRLWIDFSLQQKRPWKAPDIDILLKVAKKLHIELHGLPVLEEFNVFAFEKRPSPITDGPQGNTGEQQKTKSATLTLDEKTEQSLIQKIRQSQFTDKKSIDRLIWAHERFVLKLASQFSPLPSDQPDLVQEGKLGLLTALKKFDPSKGARFITYAGYWVRAYMLNYLIANFGPMKLSSRKDRALFLRFSRTENHLRHQLGRDPTIEELAEAFQVNEEKIYRMRQRRSRSEELPLDALTPYFQEKALQTMSESPKHSVDEQVSNREQWHILNAKLEEFAKTLKNKTDQAIFQTRIVPLLNDDKPSTLDAIGRRCRISRQAVSQRYERIKEKLRDFLNSTQPSKK